MVCPLIRVVRVEESPVINLKWIDDFHLLAIDAREQLVLVDTVKGVVSKTSVDELQLVYNSAEFKVRVPALLSSVTLIALGAINRRQRKRSVKVSIGQRVLPVRLHVWRLHLRVGSE